MISIYKFIVGISPKVEVLFRKLYWQNISITSNFKPKNNGCPDKLVPVNFDLIIEDLKNRGISNGDLIIVHSSDNLLKITEERPKEVINKLLNLIGLEGTLAMPVIRRYKGKTAQLNCEMDGTYTYNVNKTPILTGLLPRQLIQTKNVHVSRFPLNPLAAVGKFAKQMMTNNLEGENLLPHGINSSWKFCVDHNAIVVGLGVNLEHSLTILHTIEDCLYPNWPIMNWYKQITFRILDIDFDQEVTVMERKAKWGMLYFAEMNFRRDLLKNNILTSSEIGGVQIEIVESRKLYNFLKEKNIQSNGYPYCIPKKYRR